MARLLFLAVISASLFFREDRLAFLWKVAADRLDFTRLR
jgi:hypothetical protein